MTSIELEPYCDIPDFADFGVRAFTTTRAAGSFSALGEEAVGTVGARWDALRAHLHPDGGRLATARQVHAADVVRHVPGWRGWLRGEAADGHVSIERGTAMAVTVADCVPVFLAHPSGACAVLHSGWRGTVGRIVERGVDLLKEAGLAPSDLRVHLGPAICGGCYEVSPDVHFAVTGRAVSTPTTVDLRAAIADHARGAGVRRISISAWCTRCDNERFYSHRSGDAGRQLGVIVADEA
jgi:polyphenol oxidase